MICLDFQLLHCCWFYNCLCAIRRLLLAYIPNDELYLSVLEKPLQNTKINVLM